MHKCFLVLEPWVIVNLPRVLAALTENSDRCRDFLSRGNHGRMRWTRTRSLQSSEPPPLREAKGERKEVSSAPEGSAALLVNCICRGRCWCRRLRTNLLHLPTKAGSTPQEEQGCSLSTPGVHTARSTGLSSSMNRFLTLLVVSWQSTFAWWMFQFCYRCTSPPWAQPSAVTNTECLFLFLSLIHLYISWVGFGWLDESSPVAVPLQLRQCIQSSVPSLYCTFYIPFFWVVWFIFFSNWINSPGGRIALYKKINHRWLADLQGT